MEKTTLVVQLSILQKQHADQEAAKQGISLSMFVRRALATASGYDLDAEIASTVERRGRPKKYANNEERQEAARKRQAERDELKRKLLEAHEREQRRRDTQGIERSVQRKGVL